MVEKSAMDRSIRAQHIATAFRLIAVANHYMVGFIDLTVDEQELEIAKQILIIQATTSGESEKVVFEMALDLIEMEIKGCRL